MLRSTTFLLINLTYISLLATSPSKELAPKAILYSNGPCSFTPNHDTVPNLMEICLNEISNSAGKGLEITRNNGFLRLANGTGALTEFQPRISGFADSPSSPGLVLVGNPSHSGSNSRGILLRGGASTPMVNGNILVVDNFTTTLLALNTEGRLGLGTTNPKSKLEVTDGDIYINDISSGVIMRSTNGQCWRYTPDNTGVLTATAVDCPN